MIFDEVELFIDACIAEADARQMAPRTRDGEAAFTRLALGAFAHQYEHVPLYRRLCELRGASPGSVEHWSEIPAAPADIFKEDLGGEPKGAAATFLSSGTTQGSQRRSRHVVSTRSLELYRRSSLAHFAAMAMPDAPGPMSVLVLGPTAATHPSSSLGHMFGFIMQAVAESEAAVAFDAEGALDVEAAIAWLEAATAATQPVLILALSSTITAVFEELRKRKLALRLPADSRLVDTGGSKGGRSLSRGGLLKAAWRFLHIPAYLCIGEYGMTELLSQFYDDALRSRWAGRLEPRAKVGPAWTRTLVVDPATLAPALPGRRGILRHFDLANWESISALQTLDLGVEKGRGFEVLGRASDAEARGCSQLMSVLRP